MLFFQVCISLQVVFLNKFHGWCEDVRKCRLSFKFHCLFEIKKTRLKIASIITRSHVNRSVSKTINTRLPVSNPIMWLFEKENVPPKLFSWHYFGNLSCFSSYRHHSTILQPNNFIRDWKIRLLGQRIF
jgi:hypothetical protein